MVSSRLIFASRWATGQNPLRRNRVVKTAALIFGLIVILSLAGCASLHDPETSYEYTGEIVATLESRLSVGQTFNSRRPGLNGIQLWLRKASPEAKDTDILSVSLYRSPEDSQPLVTVPISYSQIAAQFPIDVAFPPQMDPPDQPYFLLLETKGGPLAVYGRNEDAYPDGALLVNGVSKSADLAFRTSYDYGLPAFLGDLWLVIRRIWLVLPLLLLLWVPGRLLLELVDGIENLSFPKRYLKKRNPVPDELGEAYQPGEQGGHSDSKLVFSPFLSDWDWSERTALALGLSAAIIPLVLLWTSTLGLHWSRWSVLAAFGIAGILLLWLSIKKRKQIAALPRPDWIDLALMAVFLLTLGTRLVMVRDLAAPAWVDPVHHTYIAHLIVEQGSYPDSYAPIVEAQTSSYHPGFHALIAAFHWLSGLELDQAMLLFGQVINALVVFAVYLIATGLTRDRLASLFSALISGLLTLMPAYYSSWGRYTQLVGLLILPVCAALLIRLLRGWIFPPGRSLDSADFAFSIQHQASDQPLKLSRGLQLAVLAALASAGLFMVHFRVVVFFALLMISFFIAEVVRSLDKRPLWKTLPLSFIWIAGITALAVLICLPWLPELLQTMVIPRLARIADSASPIRIDWGYFTPVYGTQVLWLAAGGLLISLLRARWFGPILALWSGLLLISANQGILRLPGVGMINLVSVEIMLFMPIAILGGFFVSQVWRLALKLIPIRWKTLAWALLALALIGVGFAGAQKQLPIINPVTVLFRQADRPAIAWINENLPQDETILINPFLWGYGIYAGQDGGYWIASLAGRKTMPPNLLYGLGNHDQIQHINQICQDTIRLAADPAGLRELLKREGIRYVFIGRRGGVLSAQKLEASGVFQPRYHQDGVWLFEVE
jgi:hypothetical protein